jgi:hypothetical protein
MKHIKRFNESEEYSFGIRNYLNDTFLKDIDYKITELLNEVDDKLKANEIDKYHADDFFDSLVDYINDIKDGNTFSKP